MKIAALYISPGHNYVGHHGLPPGTHAMLPVGSVECVAGRGLRGDRYWDHKPDNPGQITFFAEEVHRALLGELRPVPCAPSAYRRNVLTRGVDLNTLIGREFEVQGVRFLGTVECKPCYWMDQAVGQGADGWLRGHGGLRAKILTDGPLRVDCAGAAGLLIAGGRSKRMGRDKASLDWNGRPLGEHQAATLVGSGAWPLLLSCRPTQPWTPAGFTRVEDQTYEGGALGAFVGALASRAAAACPELARREPAESAERVVTVLSIDVPLVPSDLLERITGAAREGAVSVVPFHDGVFDPFVAAWHRSALPELQAAVPAWRSLQVVCAALHEQGLLQPFPLTAEETRQLTNLNTPDDVVRVSQM